LARLLLLQTTQNRYMLYTMVVWRLIRVKKVTIKKYTECFLWMLQIWSMKSSVQDVILHTLASGIRTTRVMKLILLHACVHILSQKQSRVNLMGNSKPAVSMIFIGWSQSCHTNCFRIWFQNTKSTRNFKELHQVRRLGYWDLHTARGHKSYPHSYDTLRMSTCHLLIQYFSSVFGCIF